MNYPTAPLIPFKGLSILETCYSSWHLLPSTHKINKEKRARHFLLSSDLGQRRTFPRHWAWNPPHPLLKYTYVTDAMCFPFCGGGDLYVDSQSWYIRVHYLVSSWQELTARICAFTVYNCPCKSKFKGTVSRHVFIKHMISSLLNHYHRNNGIHKNLTTPS